MVLCFPTINYMQGKEMVFDSKKFKNSRIRFRQSDIHTFTTKENSIKYAMLFLHEDN